MLVFRVARPLLRQEVVFSSKLFVTGLVVGRVYCSWVNAKPNRVIDTGIPMIEDRVKCDSVFFLHLFGVVRPFNMGGVVVGGVAFSLQAGHAIARPPRAFIALQAINERTTVVATCAPVDILMGPISRQIKNFRVAHDLRFVVGRLSLRIK